MELWQSLPEDFRVTTFICLGGAGFLLGLYLLGRLLTFRRPDSVLPLLLVLGGLLFGGRFIRRLSRSEHLDGHRLLKLALPHASQHNAQPVQDVEGQHGQQHGNGID